MRAWRYAFDEAMASLWRGRRSGALSTTTIAVALFVLGTFLIMTSNLQRLGREWSNSAQLSVYLTDGVTAAERATIERTLAPGSVVASAQFVSKADALARFKKTFSDLTSTVDGLGENPLPASFVIRPKPEYRTAEGVRSIARQAETLPHVEDVRYAGEWVLRAEQVARTLHQIGAVLGLIILIGVLFVVGATTRLAIQARLESLHVIRTLGGGFLFTEAPYLAEGFVLATLSSIITILLARGIHDSLAEGLFHLPMPSTQVLLGFAGAGGLLGLLGSWIAVATLPRKWLL